MEQKNNRETSLRHGNRSNRLMPRDISESVGKMPPQALDLEEAILGACMLEKTAVGLIIDILHDDDFYSEAHREIWGAILSLYRKTDPIDMRTVVNELRESGKIELVGGAYYIAELTSKVSSSANLEYHARIVMEFSIKRKLIQLASKVHQEAYEDTTDALELVDALQIETDTITGHYYKGKYQDARTIMMATIKDMQEKPAEDGITGVPCGLKVLDRMLGGFQKTDLIIIAARPGMGKTALSVEIAKGAALIYNRPVGCFFLEMSSKQIMLRMIASESEIDSEKLRKRQLADFEWQQLAHKTAKLSNGKIYIDDAINMNILELRAKARRMKTEHNIEMVVVDYLQLMRGMGEQNREQEIAGISRGLKALAKELEIPVLALSQLTRGVETRGGDKRPQLSDLRESGAIEQDADVVIFPYRPEYYKITVDEDGMPTAGLMELITAKHRNGKTGAVKVKFIGKYSKITDFDTPVVVDNAFSGMIKAEDRKLGDYSAPEHEQSGKDDDMPF